MRKVAVIILTALMLSAFVFAEKIYEIKDTYTITDSVSLTKVREFHTDKNISYTYIKADLTDPKIDLKLLKSNEGIDVLDKVLALAGTDENTLGAVNGDFFSNFSGNKGFSLGIEKKDGELMSSPINPDTMATIAYDGTSVLMTYLDFNITVVAPNTNYMEIRHLNKHTTYYGDILMYTSSFNDGLSPAPGGDVVEMIIEDNEVVEFRRNMPPAEIPENGCVLVVSEGATNFLSSNFSVGDEVKIEYHITPDLENCEMAFGGGAVIVSEGKDVGKESDYSHTVAGNNPRTAIGTDINGTTLYLVTVDGRSSQSTGMRMSHLAELMISLGCHTAVNLDGGGSTRMVAKTLWDNEMKVVNNPTEDRKVINAVGITMNPTQENSVPCGITVRVDREYAFVGQSVKVEAVVFDENMMRLDVEDQIIIGSDKGSIDGDMLTSEVGGRVKVTASYGGFTGEAYVDFIDNISGIDVQQKLVLKKGDTHNLSLNVFDALGRFVKLNDTHGFVVTSSNPNVVAVDENSLLGVGNGTCVVTVERNGISSSICVIVGEYTYKYHNSFEHEDGRFVAYPKDVKGGFEFTAEEAFSGNMSGKLTYDFEKNQTSSEEAEQEDLPKGAYYALDYPVTLSDECDTVYINALVNEDFDHSLKAQFVDGEGNIAIVPFTGEMQPFTWRGMAAYIPDDLVRPLTLTRVYVLYTPGEKTDIGEVFFDDLSLIAKEQYESFDNNDNVYRLDVVNSNVSESVRIGAIPKDENGNPLVKYLDGRVRRYVSSGSGALIGEATVSGFSGDENNIYLHLDASKSGIRTTDSKQWTMIKEASEMQGKNLFLLSNGSIFGNDEFENEVLQRFLQDCGKNVFVVTSADSASYKNVGGVHYISLDNTPEGYTLSPFSNNKSVVEFKIGDKVTFEFKNI